MRTRTLAVLYLSQGHPAKAIEIIEDLLKEKPDDASLLRLLHDAKRRSLELSSDSSVKREKGGDLGVVALSDAPKHPESVMPPAPPVIAAKPAPAVDVGGREYGVADRALAFIIERTSRWVKVVADRRRR